MPDRARTGTGDDASRSYDAAPMKPRHVSRPFRALLLGLLAVLLAGCQVRVATSVDVGADGSGRLELLVALDEELSTSLAADEVDPFAGIADLGEGWTVDREEVDGGDALRVRTSFASPAELTSRVEELNAGLDEEDPAVLEDVSLTVAEDGRATFAARAGLRPPSSTGIEAAGLQPDGDALQRLLEERGDELVRTELRVTLPGPILEASGPADGGDEPTVDGRTVTWDLPPTGLVEVSATGDVPSDRTLVLAVGAGVLAFALVAAAVALRRR